MNFKRLGFAFSLVLALTLSVLAAAQHNHDDSNVPRITVEELKAKMAKKEPVVIVDTRSESSVVASGKKIKGALVIQASSVEKLMEIPKDREVVIYCACSSEQTSIKAAQILLSNGYKNVKALKGGWTSWVEINGPVDTVSAPNAGQ